MNILFDQSQFYLKKTKGPNIVDDRQIFWLLRSVVWQTDSTKILIEFGLNSFFSHVIQVHTKDEGYFKTTQLDHA